MATVFDPDAELRLAAGSLDPIHRSDRDAEVRAAHELRARLARHVQALGVAEVVRRLDAQTASP